MPSNGTDLKTETALLRVEGVDRVIGSGPNRIIPLQPTSLTLEAGNIVLICGPSGSGKTTLLSILGCILRPDHGEIFVMGESTKNLSTSAISQLRARHFGFIFQQFHLFPSLSAQGNIDLAVAMKPRAKDHPKTGDLLTRVGLAKKGAIFPSKLSGGEKQRVAIARALVGNPSIILCDEPTASLDTENAMAMIKVLKDLAHERNSLVVLVTHDHRLENQGDRRIQMEDGRVIHDSHPVNQKER